MPMSIEERKKYNEAYYINNKKRISEMLLKKVECPLCSRQITYSNLQRHQTTPLCIRHRKNNPTEMDILKLQIEKLTHDMNLLKSN
jgi:hypothetical protein